MDLLGISILIVAIAFAVLVIFLIRALHQLSAVLSSVNKTVEKLPEQLDDIVKETGVVLHNSNNTLHDLNEKIHSLNPLFYILSDAGEASRKLSSSLVNATQSLKKNTKEGKEAVRERELGGVYGILSLVYFLTQKRKALKERKQKEEIS